jgi:hypothetical protein
MKNIYVRSAYGVVLFVLGCICYDLHSKQHSFVTIDTNQIIRHTAEGFAKARLTEDQLQQRLQKFRKDLDTSLISFAKEHHVIVISSHLVHGELGDMTKTFIDYHNSESESDPKNVKGERQ